MNETIEKVKEFHEVFGHPIGENSSSIESLLTRQLRIKLLFEELKELAEAGDVLGTFQSLCLGSVKESFDNADSLSPDGNNVNKLEELDALCDIQYVLNGKILTAGLQYVFDEGYAQVHANNMTKAHRSVEHCEETVYKNNLKECTVVKKDNNYLLVNKDGKLTKPHDHKKVALTL